MPDYPVRKNLRLKTWDYTSGGTYFITICTKDRRHTLSTIVGGDAYIAPPYGGVRRRMASGIASKAATEGTGRSMRPKP